MRYPSMNRNRRFRVSVPQLNGGLNRQDPASAVDDNQLTDGENLWWKNGVLRTRPGLIDRQAVQNADKIIAQAVGDQETLLLQLTDKDNNNEASLTLCQMMTAGRDVYTPVGDGTATVNKWPWFRLPTGYVCRAPENQQSDWYVYMSDGQILQQGRALPEGYTALTYIESDGNQVIDTGVSANENTRLEVDADIVMPPLSAAYINGQGGGKCRLGVGLINIPSNPVSLVGMLGGDNNFQPAGIDAGNPSGRRTWFADTGSMMYGVYGGQSHRNQSEIYTVPYDEGKDFQEDEAVNIRLFSEGGATAANECVQKLYGAKIWKDGELVRDMAPCLRESDGVLGLYDKVKGVFYTNAGSGSFTAGAADDGGTGFVAAQPYIPLVMVNGRGDGEGATDEAAGVLYEGYNMLTDEFRCTYTTDGKSSVFKTPCPVARKDATVRVMLKSIDDNTPPRTVEIRLMGDERDATVSGRVRVAPEELGLENSDSLGRVYLCAVLDPEKRELRFYTDRYNKPSTRLPEDGVQLPAVRSNNLELIASGAGNAAGEGGARTKICRMKRCTWFGGDRSGHDGGTRLFVCGNPETPNLIHWSSVNNPLYFPENNYAYIGDSGSAVTAMAKQGDLLILFKEREIYAAQYVAGSSFSYADVVAGRVVDVETSLAKFPITPLHPAIGCDCPDSIRLVNNKLVWAESHGHVYLLTAVNQWSERNVRDISPMIQPALQEHTAAQLQASFAGEYGGYYTLAVGSRIYLLDADTTAFQSFAYYARQERAQRALPWYIWDYTGGGREKILATVADGDEMKILFKETGGMAVYTVGGNKDNGEAIHSYFVTKLYDCGQPERKKAVRELYFGLLDIAGTQVTISYITEDGTVEDIYRAACAGDTEGAIRGVTTLRRLTPNVTRARLFGLRFESDGDMAVDGIVLNYQTQAVVR